eukprot:2368382-Rhodomonas_salina.3
MAGIGPGTEGVGLRWGDYGGPGAVAHLVLLQSQTARRQRKRQPHARECPFAAHCPASSSGSCSLCCWASCRRNRSGCQGDGRCVCLLHQAYLRPPPRAGLAQQGAHRALQDHRQVRVACHVVTTPVNLRPQHRQIQHTCTNPWPWRSPGA